jgi:hypothetical protein
MFSVKLSKRSDGQRQLFPLELICHFYKCPILASGEFDTKKIQVIFKDASFGGDSLLVGLLDPQLSVSPRCLQSPCRPPELISSPCRLRVPNLYP